MPRRNLSRRPRGAIPAPAEGGTGWARRESGPDGEWVVRTVPGQQALKSYRCPGCDQEIRPGTPHLVTWPAYARDSDLEPWDTAS
ncbi:MAG: hypothetical protein M3186_09270, partial [Actinomycetota bacterium]|nr:hypothetical protein [Actinomycetota bacterium]